MPTPSAATLTSSSFIHMALFTHNLALPVDLEDRPKLSFQLAGSSDAAQNPVSPRTKKQQHFICSVLASNRRYRHQSLRISVDYPSHVSEALGSPFVAPKNIFLSSTFHRLLQTFVFRFGETPCDRTAAKSEPQHCPHTRYAPNG